MSEHDDRKTINAPPFGEDDVTSADHEVTAPPTVPDLEAPSTPPESADSAQRFAAIVGNMLDTKLRPIAATQELTLGHVQTLSNRVGAIEQRMHNGDGRFEELEQQGGELEKKHDKLLDRVEKLEREVQSIRRELTRRAR